jgi:arylsulfatase A-like enzyme
MIILSLGLATALSGCTGNAAQQGGREVLVYDCLDGFAGAIIEDRDFEDKYRALMHYDRIFRDPWGFESPRLVKAGFEVDRTKMHQNMRRAVYLGARRGSPCSISIPVRVAEKGRARFRCALGGLQAGSRGAAGLEITLEQEGRTVRLFPTDGGDSSIPEKGWRDITADVVFRGSGEKHLRIRYASGAPEIAHLFVATPRFYMREDGAPGEPNVIFISVDSLRADVVNDPEKKFHLTPNMDAIAADGWRFTGHFVVSNWTRPGTVAMLASAYGSGTGINIFYPPVSAEEKEYFYRRSGRRPISSLLKMRGYETASIGNNAFIIDYTGIGVDLDFDYLSEYQRQWEDTIDITEEVIGWLNANRGRKFFLFINLNAPHTAYIPPEKYRREVNARLGGLQHVFRFYCGEVLFTDDYIGRVAGELKRLGLYDNTIIVLTGDHGEVFNPVHEMSPYTDKRARYSHGQTQYDEELRAPLIIKPPAGFGGEGRVLRTQVRNIDIVPTLFEIMGLAASPHFQGKSLVPVVEGREKTDRMVYSEGRMMYSVRGGGFKYIEKFYGFGTKPFYWGGDAVEEYRELFDLRRDPEEVNNIIAARPDIAASMRDSLVRERFKQPENTLHANGAPVRGEIYLREGFFYDVKAGAPGSQAVRVNRRRYRFSLRPGGELVYQTIPADARVMLSIQGGGYLLSGRYLLPIMRHAGEGVFEIDPSLEAARQRPSDEILALAGTGACYWTDRSVTGLSGVKGEAYLGRDINQLLQRWGYIQGKEKKGKL